MNSRLLSCFSLALLSSSLFLLHNRLRPITAKVSLFITRSTKTGEVGWTVLLKKPALKSLCVMAMTASWVTSWFRKAVRHRQTCS